MSRNTVVHRKVSFIIAYLLPYCNLCIFSLVLSVILPLAFWLVLISAQHVAAAILWQSVCSPTESDFFSKANIRECWEILTRLWAQNETLCTITKTVFLRIKITAIGILGSITLLIPKFQDKNFQILIIPVALPGMPKKYRRNNRVRLWVSGYSPVRQSDTIKRWEIWAKILTVSIVGEIWSSEGRRRRLPKIQREHSLKIHMNHT